MKRCGKCGETKALDDFAKDKRRSDGRGSYCKACENARNRKRSARLTATYSPTPAAGTKGCSVCGETKPLTEFARRKDSASGFRSACKPCERKAGAAKMKRWRERNPELTLERARQYREENREKERARFRRYDAEHREKRRFAIAKARAEDPEHHRALRRKWYHADPAKYKDRFYSYYDAVKNPDPATRDYVATIQHDPCAYCGGRSIGRSMEIDHIVPRSQGGTHHWSNLTAACRSCNPSKRDRSMLYWLAIR